MDASLRLGGWHSLHAVHPPLEAELGVDLLARHERDAFLVPAGRALTETQDLDLPPERLGVARVHAKKVRSEERGLFAPLPAPDLDDGVLLVVRVLGQKEELNGSDEFFAFRLELG